MQGGGGGGERGADGVVRGVPAQRNGVATQGGGKGTGGGGGKAKRDHAATSWNAAERPLRGCRGHSARRSSTVITAPLVPLPVRRPFPVRSPSFCRVPFRFVWFPPVLPDGCDFTYLAHWPR
jgi:hypothetical protein